MKLSQLKLLESELDETLMPTFEGRIFHVTRSANLPAILQAGQIKTNVDGALATSFGFAQNSYFRKRGCVSVFDLRSGPREKLEEGLRKCSPIMPASPESGIAIFFLAVATYDRLLSWDLWKKDEAWGEMVVPYVEGGHPGPIPLTDIDEVVCVEVEEDPNSLAAIIRRIQKDRNQAR